MNVLRTPVAASAVPTLSHLCLGMAAGLIMLNSRGEGEQVDRRKKKELCEAINRRGAGEMA